MRADLASNNQEKWVRDRPSNLISENVCVCVYQCLISIEIKAT